LLAIEACSGAVMRVVDFEPPPEEPSWLVHQRSALATGTYIADPHSIWLLQPGIVAPTTDRLLWGLGPLVLNEHGMRGPSVPTEKPPGVRRVLVVGGSHPMGMYVSDRGSYARVLERRLAALPGPRWEVLNASVTGHTTWQGLQYVKHHGLRFDPDVVIFDLGMNDDLPLALDWSVPDHEVTAVPAPVQSAVRFFDHSAAAYLLQQVLTPLRRADPGGRRVSPEHGLQNLEAIGELGRSEGFDVLYVQQVALLEPPGRGTGRGGWTHCPREYTEFNPRVDLCPLFIALDDRAEAYFVDEIHANAAGHALIADAMAAAFVEAGWAGVQ
jgi:lysophospholipase L1-like esterase